MDLEEAEDDMEGGEKAELAPGHERLAKAKKMAPLGKMPGILGLRVGVFERIIDDF